MAGAKRIVIFYMEPRIPFMESTTVLRPSERYLRQLAIAAPRPDRRCLRRIAGGTPMPRQDENYPRQCVALSTISMESISVPRPGKGCLRRIVVLSTGIGKVADSLMALSGPGNAIVLAIEIITHANDAA